MGNIVISVENLSKTYHLGQIGTGTFTNDLKLWWAKMRGKPSPFLKVGQADHGNRDGEEIWALRDVSFTVEQGEVLGIIGRNGAGKSTLLKILSRVTAPTEGKIKVKGRIASLLEVGTGFHPELTGRENVYLNGAILGMKRDEIARKFDEIVDFSGVEKFIDTPVKRYSSGMYVRLAFAVAAHLEPEILVVDEVLAVGDAAFQKKCLGKMEEVAKGGRTVVFVSHNMMAIQVLCSLCVLLSNGMVASTGNAFEVIHKYQNSMLPKDRGKRIDEQISRTGTGKARFTQIRMTNDAGEEITELPIGSSLNIDMEFATDMRLLNPSFGVLIRDSMSNHIALLTTRITVGEMPSAAEGGRLSLKIPRVDFMPDSYSFSFGLSIFEEQLDWIDNLIVFEVKPAPIYPTGCLPEKGLAVVAPICEWYPNYR